MKHFLPAENYNLEATLNSGQLFRYKLYDGDTYLVQSQDKYCTVRRVSGGLEIDTLDCIYSDTGYWERFFNLEDIEEILIQRAKSNSFLLEVINHTRGLHILRQDPWEALICFIISQQKSIPQIKNAVAAVCEGCGDELSHGLTAFPRPKQINADGIDKANLGYRKRYVLGTAMAIQNWLGPLSLLSRDNVSLISCLTALMELPGVGLKVANCVALFALGHTNAFPIDVHIRNMLDLPELKYFNPEDFSPYEGVLQQYLFKYAIDNRI